jgi:hypothetical protein
LGFNHIRKNFLAFFGSHKFLIIYPAFSLHFNLTKGKSVCLLSFYSKSEKEEIYLKNPLRVNFFLILPEDVALLVLIQTGVTLITRAETGTPSHEQVGAAIVCSCGLVSSRQSCVTVAVSIRTSTLAAGL